MVWYLLAYLFYFFWHSRHTSTDLPVSLWARTLCSSLSLSVHSLVEYSKRGRNPCFIYTPEAAILLLLLLHNLHNYNVSKWICCLFRLLFKTCNVGKIRASQNLLHPFRIKPCSALLSDWIKIGDALCYRSWPAFLWFVRDLNPKTLNWKST